MALGVFLLLQRKIKELGYCCDVVVFNGATNAATNTVHDATQLMQPKTSEGQTPLYYLWLDHSIFYNNQCMVIMYRAIIRDSIYFYFYLLQLQANSNMST